MSESINRKQAIITIGISGSGKSFWAKEFIESQKQEGIIWKELNRDSVRSSLFYNVYFKEDGSWKNNFSKISKDVEKVISDAINQLIYFYANDKETDGIIISDTNLNEHFRGELIKTLKNQGFEVIIKVFDVPLDVAIDRDLQRKETVGEEVIKNQFQRFCYYKNSLADCIIVDLDGTLVHSPNRGIFDLSKVKTDEVDPVINLITKSLRKEVYVIILSGRSDVVKEETVEFLKENDVYFDRIFLRNKRDYRADTIVKKELFEKNIEGKFNVLFVLDDRPKVCRMWREMGLKVLQVGDPHVEF